MRPHATRLWDNTKRVWRNVHASRIIILAVLLVSLVTTTGFYIYAKTVNVESLKSNLEEKTIVYDRQGEEAGSLYAQKGTMVTKDHVSDHLEEAIISTEDRRFYSHRGFDPIGIGRAALGLILNRGQIVGGGSTLTQQLAKNAYLSADQTLLRKLKELFIAIEIEKMYEKDDILEMYMNNAYFGNGVWGVEDASHKYFGKPSSDLNLSEAATLAGMLSAPSSNNPIDNYAGAIERRNVVLSTMVNNEFISQAEAEEWQASELYLVDTYHAEDHYKYPYYFDAVIEEAINRYDINEEDLLNNGYQIYTSLDQNHQQQVNYVYSEDWLFPPASDGSPLESASVVLDPQTGGVTALVGGRGEHTFRGFNRATQMRRQPASVIKPLTVYTPALENGYDAYSVLEDEERTYGEDGYTPYNFSQTFSGEVPLYQAVAESLNAPAVWLLNELGLGKAERKAERFGIPLEEGDKNLAALALGGMVKGATPVELASAYSTFVNEGQRKDPHFITKIVDSTGRVVVDNEQARSRRVTSESVAHEMNSILLDVFSPIGTAGHAEPEGYQLAGKTGSSGDGTGQAANDRWTLAYTPDIVISTWIGYDEVSESSGFHSGQNAATIAGRLAAHVIPYTAGRSFEETPASEGYEEEGGGWFNLDLPNWQLSADGGDIGDRIDSWIERGREFLQGIN